MHKRILAPVAALVLLLALTSCGNSEAVRPTEPQTTAAQTAAVHEAEGDVAAPQAQTQTQTQTQPADEPGTRTTAEDVPAVTQPVDDRTGVLFQKYVRDKVADGSYTLRTEQSGMKIVIAVDGSDSAVESDAAGLLHFSLVHKGSDYYMIMHTTKKYAKMDEEEYQKQINSVGSSSVDLDGMQFRESGSETVDGKRYSTETFDEREQGVVTYFFDDTGVRRTRIAKDGKMSMTDVFEVADQADASMFEIPANYTLVAEPAQLLT